MRKPVLYLQRDAGHWTVVHPGRTLGVVAAPDEKLEQALRMAWAAYPDYDVRVRGARTPNRSERLERKRLPPD